MVRFAVAQADERFACPCCGHLLLDEPPPGMWLICEICGWEDDPVQFDDIDYAGGANRVSLRQAREFFKTTGISSPERLRREQLKISADCPSESEGTL